MYGPVPVRTGRDSYETRTGLKKIYWRDIDHWSTIYDVADAVQPVLRRRPGLPLHRGECVVPPGSHGCVNMRSGDAKKYWSLLRNGDDVYVYGRKPGT